MEAGRVLLFRRFILRYLASEKIRSSVTILAFALGIAVIVSIQLTNASSVRGFERAVEAVSGATAISITSPGPGMDEMRLGELGWLREFGQASPVIEGTAFAELPGGTREILQVLGIDVLRDRSLRDYPLLAHARGSGELRPQDFLSLLSDSNAIVITEKLARLHGLNVDSELRLVFGDRADTFVIRGLLANDGPARALDGNFVLMDIAAAQLAFERLGRIDRLDVRLREGVDVEYALRAIRERLPAGLIADRPERRGMNVEKILEAFHFNLAALSYVALIVGLFLIYNTVSISVITRRHEIGTLRALGTSRRTIAGLFLAEAGVFAIVGCIVGIVLGKFFADFTINLTRSTVDSLYIANASAPAELGLKHVIAAFATGVPLSLLAALVPALEASRVPPVAAIGGRDQIDTRVRLGSIVLPLTLFAAAFGLAQLGPVDGLPLFGYASAAAIILGASLAMPAVLAWIVRTGRRPLARILRVEGRLANANLGGAISRIAISVAALAVSLAMMIAIAVVVGSFRETVIYWIDQSILADLYVRPSTRRNVSVDATISPEVEKAARSHPQVAAIDRFRNFEVEYEGRLITVGSGDFIVAADFGRLAFKAPRDARSVMVEAIGKDSVIASESFAVRFNKSIDDLIRLPTPSGIREFRIGGIYYDYSTDRGVVLMDRGTLHRHFGQQGTTSLAIYLRDGANPDQVRSEFLQMLPKDSRALVFTNASVRREVIRIFDNTFRITRALELIAILVAVLGIVSSLLTLIIERKREIGILRMIGAGRRQIMKMVLIEAVMIGGISHATGIIVGLLLSLVLIYVINVQSFGWSIQFSLPVAFLVQSTALILLTSLLSGIFPAWKASLAGMEFKL